MPSTTRMRANSESVSSASASAKRSSPPSSFRTAQGGMRFLEESKYPHTSVFKSPEMFIDIESPSVRVIRRTGQDNISLPVYGDSDSVVGCITLDPQNCAAESGRLTISVEGMFEYVSPMSAKRPGPSQITPGKHKHIFFHDSAVIPLYVASEPPTRRPFRSAVAATLRKASSTADMMRPVGMKKSRSMDLRNEANFSASSQSASGSISAASGPSSSASPRRFNFEFPLPKPDKPGDELPPSFTASNVVSAGVRGRVYAENAEVKYRLLAVWEALDGSGAQAQLEAPVLVHTDADFQSLDGLSVTPESWAETPLNRIENVPIECAITIPSPADFPRAAAIPYFVVFRTTPRSRVLAQEIMADATIAVSLVRRVGFERPRARVLTLPNPGVGSAAAASTMRARAKTVPLPAIPMALTTTSSSFSSSDAGSGSSTASSSPTASEASSPMSSQPPSPEIPQASPRAFGSGGRLFKRVVKSAPPILAGFRISRADGDRERDAESGSSTSRSSDKPLPTIPEPGASTSRARAQSRSKPSITVVSATSTSASVSVSGSESSSSSTASYDGSSSSTITVTTEVPPARVTDSRTLHTDVSVGFPKRPKGRTRGGPGGHPSLETVSALPDGLYKGSIPVEKGWFPSVHWRGLSIEYFLQVSVIFDSHEFRSQVPLRIY